MSDALQLFEAVPPTETREQAPWTYVRYAVVHPANLLFVVGGATLVCALKSMSLLVAGALIELGLALIVPRFRRFRASVEQRVALRDRLARCEEREQRLLEVDAAHREQFADLSGIVDDVERHDGGQLAQRLELQSLLDRFIEVAVAHRRCVTAMKRADRDKLAEQLASAHCPVEDEGAAQLQRQRLAIVARRARHWDECRERAKALREEIGAIAEFLRYIGQRAACPDVHDDVVVGELESRLSDLEATESAFRQLNAA